ncbi:Phosphatidylserine decarboxylase proenzyme 2 [Cladobotryum mycophilum]|uniref:phosphatidylserine decarboxylase n=1 Tax=Cladobotryum mycophilum TaxID=491253 RepID=A0ABR0SK59_9HYPO
MFILRILHSIADLFLSWTHLSQNVPVGWRSLDRKTGKLEREQQPLIKKLKLLFLFNPFTEWLDTTHAMRLWLHEKSIEKGREEGTKKSKKQIKGFVDSYGINMNEFEPSDLNAYDTFEDFFIRTHKSGSRPITDQENNSLATVVADSRVVVYNSVDEAKKLWIKGNDFSISNLVMDMKLGEHFSGAAVASFRLSPQDYHRFHSPVTGKIKLFRSIPGDYYQVDPIALRSKVDILTRNRREYVIIETEEFGDVLFVAIGATDVGSVQIHDHWQEAGSEIKKGDEIGLFQFGGSSVVVAFQRGRIKFDHDLVDLSRRQIQTSVEVGMSLGSSVEDGFQDTQGTDDGEKTYAEAAKF